MSWHLRRPAIRATALSLTMWLASCEASPTDSDWDGWSARPAVPFLLIANGGEAAAGTPASLWAVEIATGRRLHSWTAPPGQVFPRIRVSPDAQRAVSQLTTMELVLIDLQTGRARNSEPGPGTIGDAAYVSSDVVTAAVRIPTYGISGRLPWGGVAFFDAAAGKVLGSVNTPPRADGSRESDPTTLFVATFPHRFPGRVWSSQPRQQTITVFDAPTLTVVSQMDLDFEPGALAFSANGSELWVKSGSDLVVLEPHTGSIRRTLSFAVSPAPFDFALSRDGSVVYLGYANGYVRIADAYSGALRAEVRLDGPVSQLVPSRGDDELFVVLSSTGEFVGDNFFMKETGHLRRLHARTLVELQRIPTGKHPHTAGLVTALEH